MLRGERDQARHVVPAGTVSDRDRYDVIVVGAGIIGLSIAWRAAQTGCQVLVCDPDPGRGASWAAGGMLAPVAEAGFGEAALTMLALQAARAWPQFAADLEGATGRPLHYTTAGTLLVAGDPSDREALDRTLAYHVSLELAAERLTTRQARLMEPLVSPSISGGIMVPGDHHVDNRRVVESLIHAASDAGVIFLAEEVAAVTHDAGPTSGVRLADGRQFGSDAVVVAAGSRSGQIDGVAEADQPPVRPVRGVTLRLQADGAPQLTRTVRALVHGRSCYFVPRPDGGLVVGATVEERGFDLAVPLGGLGDLIADARRVIPAIDEYALVEVAPGLRPGTPDNGPIVGPTHTPGLLLATGHYRNGVLMAPLTADDVVTTLVGGIAADGPFANFRPGRFQSGDPGESKPHKAVG